MTNLQAARTLRKIADALDPPGPAKPHWPPCVVTEYIDALSSALRPQGLDLALPQLEWITEEKVIDERTKKLLGELP